MNPRTNHPTRRALLAGAALLAAAPVRRAAAPAATSAGEAAASPVVFAEVWKDPGCGCCDDWAKHLEASGFKVKVHDGGHSAARVKLGVADAYASCHVALIGGYAIEGHVPAREIRRLLQEKPQAIGLSVPGMPVGSPGMDGPVYGERRDAYKVMLLTRDGKARVYQAYSGGKA